MERANQAIQGLLRRYPTIKDGPLAGSIDWNAVRLAPEEDLTTAIKIGGISNSKTTYIMGILDKVYDENEAMRKDSWERKARGLNGQIVNPSEKAVQADRQNAAAVAEWAEDILINTPQYLTLDHLHSWSTEKVFERLQNYHGIGEKTAACVLLFCMQRPLFAVDTHVWKLCKWLGWVPDTASAEQTFMHCNMRVPDELKYSLHQLMIAHGKQCFRCDMRKSVTTPGWDESVCVLEHLLQRIGSKKGGVDLPPKRKKIKKQHDAADEVMVAPTETQARQRADLNDTDAKDAAGDVGAGAVENAMKVSKAILRPQRQKAREAKAEARKATGEARKAKAEARKSKAQARNQEAASGIKSTKRSSARAKPSLEAKEMAASAPGFKKRSLAEFLDSDASNGTEDSSYDEESSNDGAWRPKAPKKTEKTS